MKKCTCMTALIMMVLSVVFLSGCKKEEKTDVEPETSVDVSADTDGITKQLASPEKGDTIAEITVKDYGTMKVHFFKKDAPKAVENFVTHAKDGYYDGVIFHRVILDFMIQGGDPGGDGYGGESIWQEDFEDEISPYLVPLRGSLCMANRGGGNTNGSQFFIVQSSQKPQGSVGAQVQGALSKNNSTNGTNHGPFNQIVVDNLKKVGGCLGLSGGYTVFGQVYEGGDVIDKIAGVPTNEMDKPVEDVIIEKIEITEY